MREYLDHLTALSQELRDSGNEVRNKDFILTIMNGTHDEFSSFVSSMWGKKRYQWYCIKWSFKSINKRRRTQKVFI